ncbi:DUF2975 domain-containing protein [Flavobacterium sp. K5-23]|uniref:DUF2975 domain-containing protein n=1 Tax=Flavobacterium sp. K5-23 TaxID=2746225 RepID=UPI0020101174|nr:DUF2975 domain-containing protein [Flavobacterium sp. K5-23]UQD55716.1 DUF2975 domain-containing protein [Flavobacterium sp. K5-23]
MKKIIILNWVLKIFIGILILAIPINECLRYNMSNEALTLIYKDSVFGNYSPYIMLLRISILIIALLNIQKGLQGFIKDGYFNFKSSERFKISGYLLLIMSIIGIAIVLMCMKQSSEIEILSDIIIYLLLIAIAIGLLAFSDVVVKGNILKTENDLTV